MPDDILRNIWPEWQIVKRLGRGSYGVVYEVVRREFNVESRAAVKVISVPQDDAELDSLRSDGLTDEQSRTYLRRIVDDFVREIDVMRRLQGAQNVVFIEDFRVIESEEAIRWDIYVRMELLTPLSAYAAGRPGGVLSQDEVIRLGIDICKALEACEKLSIIHRDIKPENILVNETFGLFKLGDFGVARRLEGLSTGLSIKGTPNYMAPEVYSGQPYDERADLYSLGLVLHRLTNRNSLPLTEPGQRLLSPDERTNALRRRMSGEALPAPIDATPALSEVILRACAHDPAARYASAKVMREALERVQNGTYALERTGSRPEPAPGEDRTIPVQTPRKGEERGRTLPVSAPKEGGTVGADRGKRPAKKGKRNKKKSKVLPAIALAAVLALGLGLGVMWRAGSRDDRLASVGATSGPTATPGPTAAPVPTATPIPTPTPTPAPTPVPYSEADWTYEPNGSGYTITKYNGTDSEVFVPDLINGVRVTRIDDRAFYSKWRMNAIVIPDTVTDMGESVFDRCSNLSAVTLPDGLESISSHLFYGCTQLTAITLPGGIRSVGNGAFSGCSRLESIALPAGVSAIDRYAFNGCINLTAITIPDTVTRIGEYAFDVCKGLTDVYYAGGQSDWQKIAINPEGNDYLTAATIHYNADHAASEPVAALNAGPEWTYEAEDSGYAVTAYNGADTVVLIPEAIEGVRVIRIGEYAFSRRAQLTSVIIPDSVTSIGKYAFDGCSGLTAVTIPDSVTSIGKYAFVGCTELTSVMIPGGVSIIDDGTFCNCEKLTSVTMPNSVSILDTDAFSHCGSLTAITIPDGVSAIKSGVFSGCHSLVSVAIPASVTTIDRDAFSGCKALSDIYYSGSESDWRKITIAIQGNGSLTAATIHFNAN